MQTKKMLKFLEDDVPKNNKGKGILVTIEMFSHHFFEKKMPRKMKP
jgi:hypothetical protein